jgi:hypothetical protein
MLYVSSYDAIKKEFKDSVRNCFDVKFLGPAQWFLQMRIHLHNDKATPLINIATLLTLYIVTIQIQNSLNVKLHSHLITLSAKTTNQSLIMTSTSLKEDTNVPYRSTVCMLLYLAYNTRANMLFAACTLAKVCICPGKTNFHALIWLIGYLQQCPYYAIKFYPDATSNSV